jgi:hypothetical protein
MLSQQHVAWQHHMVDLARACTSDMHCGPVGTLPAEPSQPVVAISSRPLHAVLTHMRAACRSRAWAYSTAARAIAQQLSNLVASHCSAGTAAQPAKLHADLAALVDSLAQLASEGTASAPLLRRLSLLVLWQLQAIGLQAGSWGQEHEALLQEALLLWRAVHDKVRDLNLT